MNKSYFTNPYLQGENSPNEDNEDFLLDLSSIPVSKTLDPLAPTPPCSCCSNHVPESPSDSVPEPMPETPNKPQKKPESALRNVRFGKGKVFTRKMHVPKPMQVQESNSNPSNEVTISNPPLQDEIEFHVVNDDQDLPIAIRKGTRESTKRPSYPLALFCHIRIFHHLIELSL